MADKREKTYVMRVVPKNRIEIAIEDAKFLGYKASIDEANKTVMVIKMIALSSREARDTGIYFGKVLTVNKQ